MTENYISSNYGERCNGYNALYDVMLQSELPEGSIVVAEVRGGRCIFQTAERVDIFDEDKVHVLKGTLVAYDGIKKQFVPIDAEVDYYPIDSLRFPSQFEFDQYEEVATI